MSRYIKIFALIALLFVLINPVMAQAKIKQQGDLIAAAISDPLYLVSFMHADTTTGAVCDLMFESLIKYDKDLKLVPYLAESFSVSKDGLTMTFKLRKGIKWHNGAEFTATDVKVTYDLIRDPSVNSPRRKYFDAITEITTPDNYTVVFKCSKVDGILLHRFASRYIVPAAEIQKYDKAKLKECAFARNPIGTGPFQFVEWLTNQRVVTKRFDNYWDGPVGFDRYLILNKGNSATAMISTEKGESNRVSVPESDVSRMDAVPSLKVTRTAAELFDAIIWNCQGEFTQDVRVRRALSYAINKQAVVSGIYKGNGRIGVSSYPPGTPYYNAKAPTINYNITLAKKLLDEAGWKAGPDGIRVKDGKRMKLFIITNKGNILREKLLQYIQSSFKLVGVEVDAQIFEWSTYLTKYVELGRFDAYIGGFSTNFTADHTAFYHSDATPSGYGTLNRGKYANKEVDELCMKIRGTVDQQEQMKYAFRIQEIVGQEIPYTFLISRNRFFAYGKKIKNLVIYDFLDWYNPEKCWIED